MLDQETKTNDQDGETIPDRFNDECAVFGVYGTNEAAVMTALGLHALQHRGQEATGIISFDGQDYHAHHGLGHVGENFGAQSGHLDKLTLAKHNTPQKDTDVEVTAKIQKEVNTDLKKEAQIFLFMICKIRHMKYLSYILSYLKVLVYFN